MSQHILQETLWIFFGCSRRLLSTISLWFGPWRWVLWIGGGVLVLRLKTLKGGLINKRQEGKTQQRKKKAMTKMWKSAGCYRMMEAAGGIGPWAGVRAEHLWQTQDGSVLPEDWWVSSHMSAACSCALVLRRCHIALFTDTSSSFGIHVVDIIGFRNLV